MEQTIKQLVRVASTDLDGTKPIHHSLLKIKGVGVSFSHMACFLAGVNLQAKTGLLDEQTIKKLDDVVRNPLKYGAPLWMVNRRRDPETNEPRHLLTGDIDFVQDNDLKMLKKMKAYRGIRHILGLPVRGQRTRSNFRKNKGKVHLGVQRKKAAPEGEKAAGKEKGGKEKK
ncbi:MAG TPA: 30S ribosomal protein S13 [Candidatus Nanoarchaeia archaeon]|nr:30S ribosomal protein S13 [Candidatus Nanoarchaeia archaeon]